MTRLRKLFATSVVSLLCAVSCVCIAVPEAFAADAPSASKQIVRVGFFQFDGYHMESDDGTYSGYGYELLEKMARYNNWDLQFVGYDKSWSEMQQMLADGQIDILTSAQKTPDRVAHFAFSELDIGMSTTVLSVKAGNVAFSQNDFSTYNGMRIGLIEGNSRNASLENFAQSKGFSYIPVYFDDADQMVQALQEGSSIDAIVTSSLRSTSNEWVLNEFNESPFYVMTRLDDAALMDQVNSALEQMDANEPKWRTDLQRKYYTATMGDALSLTTEERVYLQECADSDVVFKVAVDPDNRPYSYFEDGEAKGIFPTIFAEIARRAGISYTVISAQTSSGYKRTIDSGEADIIMDEMFGMSAAEKIGYQVTEPYLQISISRVMLKGGGQVSSIATTGEIYAHEMVYGGAATRPLFTEKDSTADTIASVVDRTSDAAYLMNYTALMAVDEDDRNRLTLLQMPEDTIDVGVGVSNRLDARLVEILDKGVHSVEGGYATEALVNHSQDGAATTQSFVGYVYDHPAIVVIIVTVALAALVLLTIVWMRARHARETRKRELELERFVGYVCKVNDLVLEVNLQTGSCVKYELADGAVHKVRLPHVVRDNTFLETIAYPEDLAMMMEHDSLEPSGAWPIPALKTIWNAERGTRRAFIGGISYWSREYLWTMSIRAMWCSLFATSMK